MRFQCAILVVLLKIPALRIREMSISKIGQLVFVMMPGIHVIKIKTL